MRPPGRPGGPGAAGPVAVAPEVRAVKVVLMVKAAPAAKAIRNVHPRNSNATTARAATALSPLLAPGRPLLQLPVRMNSLTPVLATVLATGLSTNALRAARPYTIVDTGQTKCYDNRQRNRSAKTGPAVLRPGRPVPKPSGQLHAQRRWLDGSRQQHRPDLAAQPGHRWRRHPHPARQADLDPGQGASCEAQRRQVRRLRRLAAAVHQGTVFALRRPRHRSQRSLQHGHFAPHAVH